MIRRPQPNTEFGRLSLQTLASAAFPPVIHQDTLLGDLEPLLHGTGYLFVANDTGRIVGLVRTSEILERLGVTSPQERARWAQMPLEFVSALTFPRNVSLPAESIAAVMDATTDLTEQGVTAIATKQDVFLSWSQLSTVLCDAMSDPLTGLPNRLVFERRLQEEWSRSRRNGSSIAVIVLDVDHFKETNDRFGHAVGDAILREVALAFERSLRSYDLVVRYGGDEFTAVCLGCRLGEIEIPICRIQESLANASFKAGGTSVPISVSIGAAVRHDGFEGSEPADLFVAADDCLYRAKDARGSAHYTELIASGNTSSFTCQTAMSRTVRGEAARENVVAPPTEGAIP